MAGIMESKEHTAPKIRSSIPSIKFPPLKLNSAIHLRCVGNRETPHDPHHLPPLRKMGSARRLSDIPADFFVSANSGGASKGLEVYGRHFGGSGCGRQRPPTPIPNFTSRLPLIKSPSFGGWNQDNPGRIQSRGKGFTHHQSQPLETRNFQFHFSRNTPQYVM